MPGIEASAARLDPHVMPLVHGDTVLDFRAQGNAAQFCTTGWSAPEPEETWALGPESNLVLPSPAQPASYVMAMQLRPPAGPGLPPQRVHVLANGIEVAAFRLERRTVRSCVIPWPVIASGPDLRITFRLPDAARPCDIGPSDDVRPLGAALTEIRIYPDTQAHGLSYGVLMQDGAVPVDIDVIMEADRLPLADLALKFESLGQNCEFGLVQRQCKAEPLGLLRFSSTPLPQLLAALAARFEGMGRPEMISVSLAPTGREYMATDRSFGFVYHAWVAAGAMKPEEVAHREARRVPLLVRKLIEDLEAAEKIFVFKGMGALPEEEAFPLAMAIRRYGPNTLLFVTLSDSEHRGGTVEVRASGFVVGYIDRFAPGDNANDLLIDQWVRLCREAYRLRLVASSVAGQGA